MKVQPDSIPENTSKNTHNMVEAALLSGRKPSRVLDIPAGAGAFTKRLVDKGIEAHPCDIENILQVDAARFQRADMNKTLPYKDGFFDAAVCIDGIEHIERPFDFIREMNRVLGRNGILIISTPNISALRSRWRWFLTGHHNKCKIPLNEGRPSPLHHITMISYPMLHYLLATNGFRVTAIKTNRIKAVSWLYLPWALPAYICTRIVYGKEEKEPEQKVRNARILKHMFSLPILFGETTIIKAIKS